ncbi:NADP-dependent oxidoreductase [Streptomyces sp. NBC_01465]|uniref:NADP-dependent oxidoreductase n=1 Tax=Streptomyces sp. NBC_01465 TaxID=2903878 RepID=UPI002E348DD2|nr:NADP-dependent oxidoreductase [Streptomyces sp. NBC_01465]
MRAVVLTSFGGPEVLETAEVEIPEPGPAQVRIKVRAAAVNPVDAGERAGAFGGEAGVRVGLGWDVAGTVDAVGAGAGSWSVGDEVVGLLYGLLKPFGTHAEFVVLDASAIAAAPRSVDAVGAATLPLNGLAAARALALLKLDAGQSLLVTGAAGAVGGFAVQLARRAGLVVSAQGGAGDEELVRALGADHFVPRTGPLGSGYDGVLDAAVLGEAALAAVRDGGAHVGVIPGASPASERGIRVETQEVAADGELLAELVTLVDEGVLTLRVAETYGLEEAAKAHVRLQEGGVRGRLVLVP